MPIIRENTHNSQSANKSIYQTSFIRHSHEVLKMGYKLMDYTQYSHHKEEQITGELVHAMQVALQKRGAPRWSKHFWASEEIRVNKGNRLGSRRRRIDIEIMKSQAGPRPRLRFESKRLNNTASRREYLGKDGLGCFLDGRYASEDNVAGMIGYVQQGAIISHAQSLQQRMQKCPTNYAISEDGQWRLCEMTAELHTYSSTHHRKKNLPSILVLHTLLLFS